MPVVATPEPTWTPSLKIVTVEPTSAVPVNTGAVEFVMLSVLEEPESVACVRSGVEGAAGAVVSTVTDSPLEATLLLPAASVAVAVMLWVPEPSAVVVIV